MEFTGERYIPALNSRDELSVEHLHRYHSILPLVRDKAVLDIACGEGYGAALLAKTAKNVVGVDISRECIDHATKTYFAQYPNIRFLEGDVEHIPAADNAFDVVVSFETIEHVSEEGQQRFLAEVKRVLKKNGLFIVSTPDKENYSDRYAHDNPFHVHELTRTGFVQLIAGYFNNAQLMEQGFDIVSSITPADYSALEQVRLIHWQEKPQPKKRKYLVAIASDEPVAANNVGSVVLDTDKEYLQQVDRIIELQHEVEDRTAWALRLDGERAQQKAVINTLKEQLHSYQRQDMQELSAKIDALQQLFSAQAAQQKDTVARQAQVIETQTAEMAALQARYGDLKKLHEAQLNEQQAALQQLQIENARLEKSLQDEQVLQTKNAQLGARIETLQSELKEKERILQDLQFNFSLTRQQLSEVNNRLVTIYDSDGWKVLERYYNLKGKYLHEESTHYKFLKNTFNFLRNKKEAVVAAPPSKAVQQKERKNSTANDTQKKEIRIRTLPLFQNPIVSIIIPVYNAWEVNEKCIASIIEHTTDVAYEVIVADDGSTDETKNIAAYFRNVVHVRNETNLGFLLNCNNAATHARGQYLHFLNNDTEVTPGWLSALVRIMENDEQVGMVGSKLIYPDGKLQEAGGIIWNDASGWNYGNKQDPDAPAFNYVKEADYISGASVMIRASLWNEIGGFDTLYSPAYFEDTDLAFEARKRGYKVVYQPLSEVIHYEGYSHGIEANGKINSNSIKSYQQINKDKFFKKWKETLQRDHFPNAENVFQARDKSNGKKTIVVVDHYVPHFDRDAGSRHTFQYLELFKSLNLNIKFIGDNFYKHEPYTTVLQQMGVEVLYGVHYRDNWQRWMLDNKDKIDYVYLNRPHISIKYIDFIKQNLNAKVLYFGHDLHFFREQKQYEVEKKPELLVSAQQWKETETYLFNQADVILTPSEEEKTIIIKLVPNKKVQSIQLFFYKSLNDPITDFTNRKSLLFVGGFNHKPNVDGILWFVKEIWPKVKSKLPDVALTIVGSNAPEEILALADGSVLIKGYVSDSELQQLYSEARLIMIPLRYGAGVKGKVLEAMYYGVPFVTTEDGIEGLPGDISFIEPANSAEDFANRVAEYYTAEENLAGFSRQEVKYIEQNFSWANAREVMQNILELP